jgi:hypothetical protein
MQAFDTSCRCAAQASVDAADTGSGQIDTRQLIAASRTEVGGMEWCMAREQATSIGLVDDPIKVFNRVLVRHGAVRP